MPESPFIHLHTHSAYSLAEGAIPVTNLVKLCVDNAMPAAAITDTNNLFGAMEFALAAAKQGVQPIIGAQVDMAEEAGQIVLLCQSDVGYRNLCALVSEAFLESEGEPRLKWESLAAHNDGLICLSGGPWRGIKNEDRLKQLHGMFGDRFYIELQRHGLPEEDQFESVLLDFAYAQNIPLVATNDGYFPDKRMHEAHDALLCISAGRYVSEDNRPKITAEHYFKSADEMAALFSDIPEAIHNTVVIAQRCHDLLSVVDPILPPFQTDSGRSELEELQAQAEEGLKWRIENFCPEGTEEKPYFDRLAFELDVIATMGFPGYFLIVADFIQWSKDNNIPVGPGRGSGAGSVVAWALKITDLDPLQFNLLFERFLNPERISMPDFDVDFCQDRRDEVIHYVQEKYGHDRVAQIITFGKLQARAVVRDVGRVLQMPYGQVDKIAKMIPNNPANPMTLSEALDQDQDLRKVRDEDETTKKLIDVALKLEGLYRHASTHAAGVVISGKPLTDLVPLYRDPRSDMPVTQFNMKYVEQAGLVKFDFLGLKTLTIIQRAVKFIAETAGVDIDPLTIPLDDEKTYQMLSRGEATGVFQLESSGMRDVLKKMKPNRFEDIIALVALYRPGPMDNIPKYIAVKDEKEEADWLHPKLKPYLEETYGIMIYQEQVMQAAQVLAGYTLGAADILRRAMGKKIKAEMDAQREMFVEGALKHSEVPSAQAEIIFEQIAKFAGYGFNKSHAAAYAFVAYQTAYLKANYPVQFMTALMSLDKGNTDKLSIFKQELDRLNIPLLPPDINHSDADFKVEGEAVRYALSALKGVGEAAMNTVVEERQGSGAYKDLSDFAGRVNAKALNKRQLEQLAAAGAFDGLEENRALVHGNAELILRHAQNLQEERDSGQESLFGGLEDSGVQSLPPLMPVQAWDQLDKLKAEFDAVGFYLSAHPLDSKKQILNKMKVTEFIDLESRLMHTTAARLTMAGVLIRKQERISPKSGNKYAFLQFSDSTGVFEGMMFADTLNAVRDVLVVGEAFSMLVDAETQEDQVRLTVQSLSRLDEAVNAQRRTVSVKMDNTKPLAQLKTLLDTEGEGVTKLVIDIPVANDLSAQVALPGQYSFSAEAIRALSNNAAVRGIVEG